MSRTSPVHVLGLAIVPWLVACPAPGGEAPSDARQPPTVPAPLAPDPPADAPPTPAPEPEAGPEPEPEPELGPESEPEAVPPFDPLTVEQADVRIVKVHDRGGSCGRGHGVAAIEVEVLGVGRPEPRLGLYISCPDWLWSRGSLKIGSLLRVKLYRRRQGWPKPAIRLPAHLPVRYVRSVEELGEAERGG